jgi:hypothetical protein
MNPNAAVYMRGVVLGAFVLAKVQQSHEVVRRKPRASAAPSGLSIQSNARNRNGKKEKV